MKYLFKIPFVENKGLGMQNGYFVAHRIFLTKEERKKLQQKNVEIDTVASFLPVKIENRNAVKMEKEVFCHYRIMTHPADKKILSTDVGWLVYLTDRTKNLDDIRDGGCEFLALVYHDIFTMKDVAYPVLHQLVISDTSELADSMYQLTQAGSR
jgi:hypothetical protein